ncbi:MAG: hypothetical protein RLZZ04_261 [Cyanobacteriota bacterium]|jgi:hypothetical protein
MTHCHNRESLCLLIIDAIDNLEQVIRARELINILWDINLTSTKTEQDWSRVEILLESYEKTRDEFLEAAISDLKELVEVLAEPPT